MIIKRRVIFVIDGVEKDASGRFSNMNDILFKRICEGNRKAGYPVPSSYFFVEEFGPFQWKPGDMGEIEYDEHCKAMKKIMSY